MVTTYDIDGIDYIEVGTDAQPVPLGMARKMAQETRPGTHLAYEGKSDDHGGHVFAVIVTAGDR